MQEQVDGVADLVLTTVGWLDQMIGVEDRWQKRIEAGHYGIRQGFVGFLTDVDDIAVLFAITDAVATRFVPRLPEKGGVSAVLCWRFSTFRRFAWKMLSP